MSAPEADLGILLGELARCEGAIATWDEAPKKLAGDYRAALDALTRETLRRLVSALKSDPAARAAIKEALGDELVYAVLRRHDIVKPSINERIETALAELRPSLAAHGGDVELVRFAPPRVELRFIGACDGCAASALTFQAGVKRALQAACPEITEIVQLKGSSLGRRPDFVSPFAPETETVAP